MASSFGSLFRLTTFGESHGWGIGGVVDGCPAGVRFDNTVLQRDLHRRRPGGLYASPRSESDEPEVLSGVHDGRTTGAPIAIVIRNNDQRPSDYDHVRDLLRPGHADYTYEAKYGNRDHRGGGRSSARETAARVIGGAIARMALSESNAIEIRCAVTSIGPVHSTRPVESMDADAIYASPVRCDDPASARLMASHIEYLRSRGDSSGGIVEASVGGVPAGWGEPIYDKLSSRLAGAMLSINGATGVEIGDGFAAAARRGSEQNDQFEITEGAIRLATNHSGGILGGISNGMPLRLRVAFKPPSSIAIEQSYGNRQGGVVTHALSGRHDPTIVVRAVPVVEAMILLVLADMWLLSRASATFAKSVVGR